MALEAWQYGNPETVLQRKQEDAAKKAKACGNCIHHKSMEFKGEVWHLCEFKRYTYGKRCHLYTTDQK
jgi:hypothetical protein